MLSFIVHGPFAVEFEKRKGGRTLVFNNFWSDTSPANYLAEARGCYVFAISNRGPKPIYVGKATVSFKQETFNPTNKHKYHDGFSSYAKGSPIMYFIMHPKQKGHVNRKAIGELEDFLIQAGIARNSNLQNIKGAQKPKWNIKGVIRATRGKRSAIELDFATLFDIRE